MDSPTAWILLHLLRGGHENYCQPLWLLITWSCTFVSVLWKKCPFHHEMLTSKKCTKFYILKTLLWNCHLLGCDTMQCVRHLAAFWRITLPAASNLYVEDTGSICLQNVSQFFQILWWHISEYCNHLAERKLVCKEIKTCFRWCIYTVCIAFRSKLNVFTINVLVTSVWTYFWDSIWLYFIGVMDCPHCLQVIH